MPRKPAAAPAIPPQPSEAEWVPIGSIAPWESNPRINDAAVPQIAESIRRFGWGNPILVRRTDAVVIAGHTRLKAAQSLGMDKVLVRWMDLDPAQARALALADNKLGELADWDDAALREVLADLEQDGLDLSGLGWSDEEMSTLLEGIEGAADGIAGALAGLPEGDRLPIQSMAFTLHDDQAETVRAALEQSKALGDFGDTGNENGNGNALARICELWMGVQS